MLLINQDKCICCGACVVLCTNSAIKMAHGKITLDSSRCTECTLCIYKCYARAIEKK